MGTSVSQPSPRNSTSWKRVFVCYENDNIPDDRVVNEVWRASENFREQVPISNEIKSESIFKCYEVVKNSKSFQEAIKNYNDYLVSNKNNSIIAEFAKRVIPMSFQSSNPENNWKCLFFSEVTKYVISRDAPGFINKENRNKTVSEMMEFKKRISSVVQDKINNIKIEPKSYNEWKSFVDSSINNLKAVK